VELIELYAILGIFIPVFLVAVWQLNRANPVKKAVKAGDNSIKEMYNTYNTQVQDVLKVKDKQIASLSAKLRNYEEEPGEEKEEVVDLIKSPEIQKILQARGINPDILNNPLVAKYIKKYTKGMSIQEVLDVASQLGFLKGNKQSEGTVATESQGYNPNWA